MKQLQSWWKGLSRRDQRLLAVWLVGVTLATVFWVGNALAAAQKQAQAQLMGELKVLSNMRTQADEMLRLKQLPTAGGNAPGVQVTEVESTLTQSGLPPGIVQSQQNADDQISLRGIVSFDKWVEWLARVQKDMRLVVRTAKILRSDRAGMVEIQATLELPKE